MNKGSSAKELAGLVLLLCRPVQQTRSEGTRALQKRMTGCWVDLLLVECDWKQDSKVEVAVFSAWC